MLDRGYLIVARSSPTADYLACARVLAKSLKLFHPDAHVTLVTDGVETDTIFDIVRNFMTEPDPLNPYAADWQAYGCSPYHETIKIEADMVITSPVDHWWHYLRHRDLVIATGALDFRGTLASSRKYRQIFDANDLPDVYNGITYWRKSQLAQDFFALCSSIFAHWPEFSRELKYGSADPGTTDIVYACASKMLGVELTTLPGSYPRFVHMKPAINGTAQEDWTTELVWELGRDFFRINTITQQYPLHYYVKDFAHTLEPLYDNLLGRSPIANAGT